MQLDFYGTLVAASLVLLLGQKLLTHIRFLRSFNIPEPVAGGLLVAMILLAWRLLAGFEVKFDPSLQTPLMLAFFASIGLSADFSALKKGGKIMGMFLMIVVGLLFIQNGIGVSLAHLLELDPRMGLLAGSITLSGGHGTGSAWSGVFQQQYGITGAAELAMACATFGLVLGGLLGGPVARHLVKQVATPGASHNLDQEPQGFELPEHQRQITAASFIGTLALIALSLLGGTLLAGWLKSSVFELPTFVCVLFTGAILRNGLSTLLHGRDVEREVSLIGNISLSLFLAIALMSLKLWELAGLALPIFVLRWHFMPCLLPSASWGATMMRSR